MDYEVQYLKKCQELEILYVEMCELKQRNEMLEKAIMKAQRKIQELETCLYVQDDE